MMRQHLKHPVYVSAALRGASPVSSGEEETGLPNLTSAARTPQRMILLLATALPNFYESRQVGAVKHKRT